jgi:plasmid stabilization system protein ParE
MRVRYAPRAIRDLADIAAYYRSRTDEKVAGAIGKRIEHVIGLVARDSPSLHLA